MIPSASTIDQNRTRIGYVLKVFPRVSETFVANEIVALERLGTEVIAFSLHAGDGSARHAVLREKRGPTIQVDSQASPDEDDVRRAIHRLAIQHRLDDAERRSLLPRKYVRLALQLAKLATEHRITHFHAHFASRATHVAALTAALTGLPYSFTAHAKDLYHCDVDLDALRWKVEQAQWCVTVTDYNLTFLRRMVAVRPGQAEKILRLYNGINLDRFLPAPPARGNPSLILAVGRLVPKKGFDVLVRACSLLRGRNLRFRCDIIGSGPEEPALRALIDSERLNTDVHLLGPKSSEEVAAALRQATVVTLPCIVAKDGNVDALPTVLLEAMATGRPAVSTSLSGIPEIICSGETGLLVEPGDPIALADALATICNDSALAAAMGERARRRCERMFDLQRNVGRLHHLFNAGRRTPATA